MRNSVAVTLKTNSYRSGVKGKLAFLLSFLLAFLLVSTSASSAPLVLRHFNDDNRYQVYFTSRYTSTASNFTDQWGVTQRLPGSQGYSALQNPLFFRMALTRGWRIGGEVSFHWAESTTSTRTSQKTGLGPWMLETDFLIAGQTHRLIGHVSMNGPSERINFQSPSANTALLSDDSFTFSPALIFDSNLYPYALTVELAPVLRNNDYSQLIRGSGQAVVHFGSLKVGLQGNVIHTVVEDGLTNRAFVRNDVNRVANGSSLIWNAINPSSIDGSLFVGYELDPGWEVLAGVGQTFFGLNSAFQQFGYLQLRYDLPFDSRGKLTKKEQSRQLKKKFIPEEPKVPYQDYFDPDDPSQESMEEELDKIEESLKKRKSNVKRKR